MKMILAFGAGVLLLGAALLPAQPAAKLDLDKLIKDLDSADNQVRINAAVGLADLGAKAAPAVPKLAKALQSTDEDMRLNAALALGKIGQPAVKPLVDMLDTKDDDQRYYAVWALGWIGPDAKEAAPKIIEALADKNEGVRRKAAFTLGRIGADPKTAIAELAKVFQDKIEDVRKAAAEALAKYGEQAVPTLIGILEKGEKESQVLACFALGEIGSDAAKAVKPLQAILQGKNEGTAEFAAGALSKIGKTALPAFTEALKDDREIVRQIVLRHVAQMKADGVGILVDGLGDKRVDVRRVSAQMLGPMNIGDKSVVIALGFALKDDDDQVKLAAAQALQNLGPAAKLGAQYLHAALADTNPNVRMTSYWALQRMGENPQKGLLAALNNKDIKIRVNTASLMMQVNFDVPAALPGLRDALTQKDLVVRMQAAHTLALRGQDRDKVLPIFVEGLKHEKAGIRGQAMEGLQHLGGQGGPAAEAVFNIMMKDPEAHLRSQAIGTYRNLGGKAETMVPALTKLLKEDPSKQVRQTAMQGLQNWGQGAGAAAPVVLDIMVKDPDPNLRQQAVWTLQNIRGDAATMIPALTKLLKDNDKQLRQNALQILGGWGQQAGAAAPTVLEILQKDPEINIRQQAIWTLQNIRGNPDVMIPALAKLLKDDNQQLRQTALQVIGQFGPKALPHIFELIDDKNPGTRQQALWAMQNVTGDLKDSLPALAKMVKTDKQDLRFAVVQLLGRGGESGVSLLIDLLKDKDDTIRSQAAQSMRNLGAKGRKAAPQLIEMATKDGNANNRILAVYALVNQGNESLALLIDTAKKSKSTELRQSTVQGLSNWGIRFGKEAMPFLIECLQEKGNNLGAHAANALANQGTDGQKALVENWKTIMDANTRQSIINALWRFRYRDKSIVPLCVDGLKTENKQSRWMAAQMLAQLGKDNAKEAAPALIEALADSDGNVRNNVINALNLFGDSTHPALVDVLKKDNSTLRENALQVLLTQKYKSKAGVMNIVETLKDKSATVKTRAASLLGQIGPEAKAAIPALEGLADDGDANVRQTALAAIKSIKGK